MRALKAITLALVIAFALPAYAEKPIVTSELNIDAPKVKTAEPIMAAVTLAMPPEWHVYWKNPGDSGLAPTFAWTLPQGIMAGDVIWPIPRRIATGDIINYGYADRVTFLIPLTPQKDDITGEIDLKVSWLVCKDTCIPESANFKAYLPQHDVTVPAVIKEAQRHLTKPLEAKITYEVVDKNMVAMVITTTAQLGKQLLFIPFENGAIANEAPQKTFQQSGRYYITTARGNGELVHELHGVLIDGDNGYDITAVAQNIAAAATPPTAARETKPAEEVAAPATMGLPAILLLALLGGLLLNLMPCVLPILSLKALALAKKSTATSAEAKRQGLGYALGVIGGFLIVALILLSLKSAGEAIGWGFQLQRPGFVVGLTLLMLLVSVNLIGWFELPVLFGGAAAGANESSFFGSFFTGALAVALATPCTAPFMAAALGATLALPKLSALLVFATLGLGMALPFLIVSFWPAARRLIPHPGPWMEHFKQFLALLVFITAGWLMSVLAQLTEPKGVALALYGAVMIILLVRLYVHRGRRHGLLFLIGILAVSAVAIGYQPPARMPDMPQSMGMLTVEPYNAERLNTLRAQNTPVFVDATAAWCITCKINERTALRSSAVQQAFVDHGIVMMIADWTSADAAITNYLASFNRNGVPLYVYYPPKQPPRVLPQLLTPSLVLETLASS